MSETRYEREILAPARELKAAGKIEESEFVAKFLGRAPFLPFSHRPKKAALPSE
jgi:hypothetical protein